MKYLKHFFKEISSILTLAYIFILFTVYPLYIKREAYLYTDASKYKFFLYTALGAIVLLLLSGLFEMIQSITDRKFGPVNASIFIFAVITVVSYALSDYKSTALIGANGWYMGLVTILIMCVLSYLISVLYTHKEYVWYPILGGAFIVFILGILDRFSLYILPLENRHSSFISTLGNINWFMGYYCVLAPIGVFFLLKEFTKCKDINTRNMKANEKCKIWLLLLYVVTAFVAGFVQGAESVLLFFIALFVGMTVLWMMKVISFESLLSMVAIWGLSGQIVRILRTVFAKSYNYETQGILSVIQTGRGTLFIALISIVGIYHYKKAKAQDKDKVIKIITLGLMAASVVTYVVIGILNTKGLLQNELGYSVFRFDEGFGSGRGKAYKIAFECLGLMSPKQIIFGVGPDCFSAFAYSVSPVAEQLYSYWPNDLLANTHCEILTMLINEGIIGVLSYLGIFICAFITFVKKCKKPETLCISLSIFCYLVHNLISFGQELNTPLLFALIGIGNSISLTGAKKP